MSSTLAETQYRKEVPPATMIQKFFSRPNLNFRQSAAVPPNRHTHCPENPAQPHRAGFFVASRNAIESQHC
jgi:hypothetical protein